MNHKKSISIGIVAVSVLLSFFAVLLMKNSESKLDETIRILITEKLGVEYVISKISKGDLFTDVGAEWELSVSEPIGLPVLRSANFQHSDNADLIYFKDRLKEKLRVGNEFVDYELYRAEITLGKYTICETKPCNVYILRKTGQEVIYGGVYIN